MVSLEQNVDGNDNVAPLASTDNDFIVISTVSLAILSQPFAVTADTYNVVFTVRLLIP